MCVCVCVCVYIYIYIFGGGLLEFGDWMNSEWVWDSKATLILMLESWGWISTVMGGVPTKTLQLKSGSARNTRYRVYYTYLSSMMSHLFIVGNGWGWKGVFHDSRSISGLSMLVGKFKTYDSTFDECGFGMIVDAIQQSYPCAVWKVPLFGFRVGTRIVGLSWAF